MPGGDGTGPVGRGPRTGRGAGFCAGYDQTGSSNPGAGGGMRRGRLGQGGGLGMARKRRGRDSGRPEQPRSLEENGGAEISSETNESGPWQKLREELAAIRGRLRKMEDD